MGEREQEQEQEKDREKYSYPLLASTRAAPGQCQEAETPSQFPMWVTGSNVESSSTSFQDALTGS